MEKCGVCAHITNEFVVIPEAKPREITTNELVIRSGAHTPHFSIVYLTYTMLNWLKLGLAEWLEH